jgi:hypothetical protein
MGLCNRNDGSNSAQTSLITASSSLAAITNRILSSGAQASLQGTGRVLLAGQ